MRSAINKSPVRESECVNLAEQDAELGGSQRPTLTPLTRVPSQSGSLSTRPLPPYSPSHSPINYFGSPDGTLRYIHASPERRRSREGTTLLNRVPEDNTMEFDAEEAPRYTDVGGLYGDNGEEEDWLLDEQLAEQGLYRGSYKNLVAIYTLTPLTAAIAFLFFASLPQIAYPINPDNVPTSYPYAPYLPFPTPELLTSIALWSLAYHCRDSIFTFCALIAKPFYSFAPLLTIILSTTLQAISSLFLRQLAIPLLFIPHDILSDHPTWHDGAFKRVWWVALGWALAEALVGIKQGYQGIALYRDVLVTLNRIPNPNLNTDDHDYPHDSTSNSRNRSSSSTTENRDIPSRNNSTGSCRDDECIHDNSDGERQPLLSQKLLHGKQELLMKNALELELEHDLDQFMALKNREELEDVYGMPVIHIPVFISCLHRINGFLSSLGITLLLSAAYLRSTFAINTSLLVPAGTSHPSVKSNTCLIVTLPVVLVLQLFLDFLHTPAILPRIGIHTFVYAYLLISLGMFFAGLGVWEALT